MNDDTDLMLLQHSMLCELSIQNLLSQEGCKVEKHIGWADFKCVRPSP